MKYYYLYNLIEGLNLEYDFKLVRTFPLTTSLIIN